MTKEKLTLEQEKEKIENGQYHYCIVCGEIVYDNEMEICEDCDYEKRSYSIIY